MIKFSPEGRLCSFCGIVGGPHTKFAGGLGSMICAECISTYHHHFSSEENYREVRRPPWEQMDKSELLDALPRIASNAEQIEEFLHGWVRILRARKVSWTDIGNALSVSRQAAWERFAKTSRSVREAEVEAS